ncbi:MAG TPA: kynureninase [Tissierellia bacterium]|nr:kynureninase [Tissierellia bacterium]
MANFQLGIDFARQLDQQDQLAQYKERFYLGENELYFDGNSLGACSKDAEKSVLDMLEVWKKDKILMWNVEDGKYFKFPQYLGGLFSQMLKADANELTITNSVTINIHQLLATFYRPTKQRYKILVDELNFPTDIHAVVSQVLLHGLDPTEAVVSVRSRDGRNIEEDDIIAAMDETVAVALFPAVMYRSAQLLDMARITRAAHEKNILIGWDLCHSIGSVPHDFKQIEPDFAVWCTYKHISAGPGSNAGLYINKRHFGTRPGLAGWHGNRKETQFLLDHEHTPAPDVDAWLTGTPNMLSMAPIEGVVKLYNEAGIDNIREKSLRLTDYLIWLIEQRLSRYGFNNGTLLEHSRRGGHVALEHEDAFRISLALKARQVIPDFREPNVIRLAPAPMYTSFEDVYRLVEILDDIMQKKSYDQFSEERSLVV